MGSPYSGVSVRVFLESKGYELVVNQLILNMGGTMGHRPERGGSHRQTQFISLRGMFGADPMNSRFQLLKPLKEDSHQ